MSKPTKADQYIRMRLAGKTNGEAAAKHGAPCQATFDLLEEIQKTKESSWYEAGDTAWIEGQIAAWEERVRELKRIAKAVRWLDREGSK